jgi:hypothetical protein
MLRRPQLVRAARDRPVTTIAAKAGHSFATDRMISGEVPCEAPKIDFLPGIGWIAFGGGCDDAIAIVELIAAHGMEEAMAKRLSFRAACEGLLLREDGTLASVFFGPKTRRIRLIEVASPFYAIGSGAHYAMGAMAAGASPKRAVEIAAQFDGSTGFGVDVIKWPT